MANRKHRALCIVLCLLLALSALAVGTSAASAAAGDTVYVRLNNGWSQVYIYAWTEGAGNNGTWPGVKMTKVTDDVYSYTYSSNFDMVIFNNGSGGNGNQTSDLTYTGNGGNGRIYDLSTGSWSDYTDAPTKPTTSTKPTTATQPTTGTPGSGVTVYLKNDAGWSNVKCYMWNSNSDKNANWPGESMTLIDDGVYMYTSSKVFKNCIFSNGGNPQTNDLTVNNGYIYNNKTNQWEVYDTSPLQVRSFVVEPSTGIYKGSDVTLSTLAENTNTGAAVSYKFSVTNSSGSTSVLSQFSNLNSIIWTPASAGDYTITFDYKDTEGNKNQRTVTVTVLDDSSLEKPVIKGVTPANLNPVKVNSAATVTVKAGGGNTGTHLLFYKYVVVDPNGVKNTPYYTLSNTYKFTPTLEGTYKVTVYVQGSDNSTVNKTYSYNAINGELPSTSPRPTSEQPTTGNPFVKGDANHNGKLDIDDVTYIQKSMADFTGYDVLVSECDMDNDGVITIMDCTVIQKILSGYDI